MLLVKLYLAEEISLPASLLICRDEALAVVALGEVVGPVHHVEAGEGQREDEPRDHVDPLRLRRHLASAERAAVKRILNELCYSAARLKGPRFAQITFNLSSRL